MRVKGARMFKDFEHNGEQFKLTAETYNTHFEYWETKWAVTYPDNTKFDFSLKIAPNNAEHPKCYDWIAEYAMWKRRSKEQETTE